MKLFCTLLLGSLSLLSCNQFEYSPNQVFDNNSLKDINATNLKRLGEGKNDDTVRFILTGDTQQSRNETVKFTDKVNSMSGIDFVIVSGDISEFGVLKEMDWISKSLAKLNVPYVAVIGNHDLTARGKDVFLHMFGELNYSFVYGGVKFICHDTNSREYNFNGKVPDLPWLKNQLLPQSGVTNYIAISHVPPNSPDFDSHLIGGYTAEFANTSGFLTSLHAHNHSYETFYPDNSGIPYTVTSAMGNREFLLVEIINHKLSFERISF